jgi:hypothetical protein
MLLVFTSAEDATADYLCERLSREEVSHVRLDTDTLLSNVAVGYVDGSPSLRVDGRLYRPDDISNVWYRRPEALKSDRYDDSPESSFALGEWSEALEGFFAHIPSERWMNHPAANFAASHKLEQLSAATSLGLQVPLSLVTQDSKEAIAFYDRCEGRVIAKPLSVGYVERADGVDSLIYTNLVNRPDLDDRESIASCPTLFQRYVEKDADYRITVVDGEIHTAKMIAREVDGSQRCDVRRNNMVDVLSEPAMLPECIATALLKLVGRYELRFGAIDMATTVEGDWIFFEINPNGQWAWLDIASKFDIASAFVRSFGRREI